MAAAADPAVYNHFQIIADGIANGREAINRRRCRIQLPAPVIADHDGSGV